MLDNFIIAVKNKSEDITLEVHRLSQLDLDEKQINTVIELLPYLVKNFTEVFEFTHGKQIIKNYKYESIIWDIGECLRNIIKRNRLLRKNPTIFRYIENVAVNRIYGKGRESFVMLLGQYGGNDYTGTLIKLLQDSQVNGHAVYALRLLKASEAQEAVKPFLESKRTWVRNEAKKYFSCIDNNFGKDAVDKPIRSIEELENE